VNEYLKPTDIIDWEHPAVINRARKLSSGLESSADIARRCFEWVRDRIPHSYDVQKNVVTCRASEVLQAGTGICHAKSHLLAALLRANGVPAGLCYQRLRRDDGCSFVLHGLNAVHLPAIGWYRIDARGNRSGVDAQFTPPIERLAFRSELDGEIDLPEIWPEPLPMVVRALTEHRTLDQLWPNLPDVAVASPS
jgi:transglutaminase-like putative cysteine protease